MPTPNSMSGLSDRVREASADFRSNWKQWWRDVQANPALIFQSLAVRIVFWLVLAFLAYLLISQVFIRAAQQGHVTREEPTRVATLYVACVNPDCLKSATAHQPLDFKGWPMKCDSCGRESAYRAQLCKKCRSWFAAAPDTAADCPHCRKKKSVATSTSKPVRKVPDDPDDREDGWEP